MSGQRLSIEHVSRGIFEPHTHEELELHQTMLVILAVVNILTITVTFLLSPAL